MTKTDCIMKAVKDIPYGKVATYGDISQHCYGHRHAGRAVGAAIMAEKGRRDSSQPDRTFPWWRVVDVQRVPVAKKLTILSAHELLKAEGVEFDGKSVRYKFQHKFD